MADGRIAPFGRRRIVRADWTAHFGVGPRSAALADAAHRRRTVPDSAGRGSRGVGGLRARRQLFHRNASRPASARIYAAPLRSAALARCGQHSVRTADASQPDHHLERRAAETGHAGGRRSRRRSTFCFQPGRARSSNLARTRGPFQASTPPAASQFWRTIRTWSFRFLPPGIRFTFRRPVWMSPEFRCPACRR